MAAGGDGLVWLHVLTFLVWTLGVAAVTWFICRHRLTRSQDASEDHFIGARSLRWYFVAGSLMLTNLSTEQLVGLNGNIFADGCLAGIWWEAGASVAMMVCATVVLPRYMALGLATTSGFLGARYDVTVRTLVSGIFLLYYVVFLCPLVLYTGALAIRNIFDIDDVPLWWVSTVIGVLGSAYALAGGLRAVAVSDTLNGVGLLIFGLWVPIAGLSLLPGGISGLFEDPEYLRSLVSRSMVLKPGAEARAWAEPSVPWHTTFTGLTLSNMYYWSTNQVIVQRVLAAETLAQGQKGVLFAASMKVVGFTFLCLPGLIGIILVREGVEVNGVPFQVPSADEVYPELVKASMPRWSLGFFSAVLLGSVLSTFNSALNSAATLFGLEFYSAFINREASSTRVVRVATVFGAVCALLSFVIAPQLVHVKGIFPFLQQVNTVVSLPILTVFFVGIASTLPDAFAAKVGFVVAILGVTLGQLIPGLHYLHLFFLAFAVAVLSMALATAVPPLRRLCRQSPRPVRYVADAGAARVCMVNWAFVPCLVASISCLIAVLIIALQAGRPWLFYAFWALWALGTGLLICLPARARAWRGGAEEGEVGKRPKDGEGAMSAASGAALPRLLGRSPAAAPHEKPARAGEEAAGAAAEAEAEPEPNPAS